MKYRKLGNSDLIISEISFGCMSLEDNVHESARLIHKAIDEGINFFDTADIYQKGRNEELLGLALKAKRKDVYIASKVGNVWKSDGSGLDWNPGFNHIIESVEKSLQRLGTDYLDLYQLHGGTIADPIDETISAFEALKKQGKIRHYGISSIRPNIIKEYINKSDLSSVMLQFSLLDRRSQEELFGRLEKNGVGVLCRGSLTSGLLVKMLEKGFLTYSSDQVDKARTVVKELSNSRRSPSQTLLLYAQSQTAITSVVAGIRTQEQLTELLEALTQAPLTEKEISILESALPPLRYVDHR